MEARASLTNARIAPRKVQIVLDLIRGKDVETAMAILKYTPKSACEYLEKLLKSAIANAENSQTASAERETGATMAGMWIIEQYMKEDIQS